MSMEVYWVSSVGFRHVIEDGLAILDGRAIDPARRDYVLSDLSALLLGAQRGADLVRENALFVSATDQTASQSYSLFDRYLGQKYQERWRDLVAAAGNAIDRLQNDPANVPQGALISARNVLEEILQNLRREPQLGIPAEPDEVGIRG